MGKARDPFELPVGILQGNGQENGLGILKQR